MDFREIERRLSVVEKALAQLGVSLGESLESLDRAPAAACIHTGVVVEHILRDLWRRLKLKGPPERRQLEDLLTITAKKMEEDGTPIPRRIHDHMRGLQLTRNRAAHYWDATREDAQDCLWKLSDVAHWYFVTFLPSYEQGAGGSEARAGGRGDKEAADASGFRETKAQEERHPQVDAGQPLAIKEHGRSELAAEPKKEHNELGSSATSETFAVDRQPTSSPSLPVLPQDIPGAGAIQTSPAGKVLRQQILTPGQAPGLPLKDSPRSSTASPPPLKEAAVVATTLPPSTLPVTPGPVAKQVSSPQPGATPPRPPGASTGRPVAKPTAARKVQPAPASPSEARPGPLRPRNGPNIRWKPLMYLLAIATACAIPLAGAWFLWPWSQTADVELQRDWDDSSRVTLSTGISLPFYRERGPKRVQSWKRSAEANNPMGMCLYARCLQEGIGVSKDESEAFKWFHKAADMGNSRAMNSVGFCFSDGTAGTKDVTEAVKWYRKAAHLREPTAMTNLGYCYLEGTGVERNEKEAVQWFREAASLGHSRAMNKLGHCYQNGTGVAKDEKLALQWFREAADLGNAEAMSNLGDCHQYGTGVAKDQKEAVEWYRKAVAADGVDAMIRLAVRMIEGDEFVARSPFEALTMLNKAQAIDANTGNSKYQIQENLVTATLRLAQDDLRATRYGEARTRLNAALTASESLNKERPGRFYFMQDLGRIWCDLGNLERAEGNANAAADCYRKSMAVDGPEMTTATEALAELLEKGEGVAKDEAKANELRAIRAKQKIKRITVTCKIGEAHLSYPVHVYFFEVFPWRHPLETQFRYFREERGFDLPKDVMDTFERVYKISKEKSVSFTELCEYAFSEKKDVRKDSASDGKK